MTIAECNRRVSGAVALIGAQKAAIVEDMGDEMVIMEQKRMWEGLLSTGKETTPYYTPFTVQVKKSKGQPADRVTLYDTGDFYSAMFAKVSGDNVVFDSDDWKSKELKEKYTEQIFGLTDENKEEAKGMFTLRLIRWFKGQTGL